MTIMEMVGIKMEITKNITKKEKIMNIMKKIRIMNKIKIINNNRGRTQDQRYNK